MASFTPPIALASLSGESDAPWALAATDLVGAAFIGGVALDAPTRTAARGAVSRGRDEFLPPDPIRFIEQQLADLEDASLTPGVNVRASDPAPIEEAATVCADLGAILEINAHCRQPECTSRGCGQALLQLPERLEAQVSAAAEQGASVSVKLRTEVAGVELPALGSRLVDAGASFLHVDAMDSRWVIEEIVDEVDTFVIANNNVRTRADVREYLSYGADAVSIGRASTERAILKEVHNAIKELSPLQ